MSQEPKFTDKSQKAIERAKFLASSIGRTIVSSEYLLLGLIDTDKSISSKLKDCGVTAIDVHRMVKRLYPKGSPVDAEKLSFSASVKRVLSEAQSSARGDLVDNRHLMGALVLTDGCARSLFSDIDADSESLEKWSTELLGQTVKNRRTLG